LVGCVGAPDLTDVEPEADQQPVIVGEDNRVDYYQVADPALRDLMLYSTAMLVRPYAVDKNSPDDDVKLFGAPHGEINKLCADAAFRDQNVVGFCSATLIDGDTMVTAGHCIRTPEDCQNTTVVFNYAMQSPTERKKLVRPRDLYACKELISQRLFHVMGGVERDPNLVSTSSSDLFLDYAVFKLDRTVYQPYRAARVRTTPAPLPAGAAVLIAGYPSGLPVKAALGGAVTSPRAEAADFFGESLDAFRGNSGAGVFLPDLTLVGTRSYSESPIEYVYDPSADCFREYRIAAGEGGGSMYVHNAVAALCATRPSHLCGNAPAVEPLPYQSGGGGGGGGGGCVDPRGLRSGSLGLLAVGMMIARGRRPRGGAS
jgi:hypothetical protein